MALCRFRQWGGTRLILLPQISMPICVTGKAKHEQGVDAASGRETVPNTAALISIVHGQQAPLIF